MVQGRKEPLPIGLGGMIYLTGLEGPTVVEVTWSDERCSFTAPIPEGDHPLPSIPVICADSDSASRHIVMSQAK